MKYILTQDELESLRMKKSIAKKANKELIQDLCTQVCNHKIVKFWGSREEPWGCILNEKGNGKGYCDECPVQDVCPHEYKKWSK